MALDLGKPFPVDETLQRQAELLDLAYDAMFVRGLADDAIQYWNRAAHELYGWTRDEALGQSSHVLLQTQFPEPLDQIERTMIETGRWTGELLQTTRNGRRLIVESRWALQRAADGSPLAFLEINRDVTERRANEEHIAALNTELRERVTQMEVLTRATVAISSGLSLSDVLQRIVDTATEVIGARYAALGVADPQGRITQFITAGITPEQRAQLGPLPQGHGLLGVLILEGRPLHVPDIAADPRSIGFPPHHPPMTNLLGMPIRYRDRMVGNLYLTDKVGADDFDRRDEEILLLLATHAGVAIENARLYEQAQGARDRLSAWNRQLEAQVLERTREIERASKELTTRVLQAQEDERKRIARELHDETAQSLTTLLINLDFLSPHVPTDDAGGEDILSRVRALAARTLEETRALSHNLRPTILDDVGLVAAIQWFGDEFTATFGVPVEMDFGGAPEDRLPSEMETALFRITQEALMNAGKYAEATLVHVSLAVSDDEVCLTIDDNGKGFDLAQLPGPSKQGGLGLYGLQERAALLGGAAVIDTAPGEGTRVCLTVPYTPPSDA